MKWMFKEDIVIDESCEIILVNSEKPREWRVILQLQEGVVDGTTLGQKPHGIADSYLLLLTLFTNKLGVNHGKHSRSHSRCLYSLQLLTLLLLLIIITILSQNLMLLSRPGRGTCFIL